MEEDFFSRKKKKKKKRSFPTRVKKNTKKTIVGVPSYVDSTNFLFRLRVGRLPQHVLSPLHPISHISMLSTPSSTPSTHPHSSYRMQIIQFEYIQKMSFVDGLWLPDSGVVVGALLGACICEAMKTSSLAQGVEDVLTCLAAGVAPCLKKKPRKTRRSLQPPSPPSPTTDEDHKRHSGHTFLSREVAPFAESCRNRIKIAPYLSLEMQGRSKNDDLLDVELGVQWLRGKARGMKEESERGGGKGKKRSLTSSRAMVALQDAAWRAVGMTVDAECMCSVRDLLQQFSSDLRAPGTLSPTLLRFAPAVASASRCKDATRVAHLLTPLYPAMPLRILTETQMMALYDSYMSMWVSNVAPSKLITP